MKKAQSVIKQMLEGEALTFDEIRVNGEGVNPELIIDYIDNHYYLIKTDIGVGRNKYVVYSLPISIKVGDLTVFVNGKGKFVLPGRRQVSYKDALKWAGL